MHMLDIPEEILIVVVGSLSFLDLVRLRQVCSQWKTSIDTSLELQYSIALGLAGRKETSNSSSAPIQDKLLALKAAQSIRDAGRLSHWGSAQNSDRSMINMKLLGSGLIMASHPRRDPTPNGEDPKRVVHLTAPDLRYDDDYVEGSLKQWTLVIPSITTVMDILAIDPAQNLIVQRAEPPRGPSKTSSNVQLYFTAITLDSAQPHPNFLALNGVAAVPAPADWVVNEPHYTRYQILDTSMLVIFADIRRCAAVLLNWRSGEVLACFVPEPQLRMSIGGSAASIALLSETSILHGTHDKFTQAPCIGLYVLGKSSRTPQHIQECSPTGRLHLLKRYLLPNLRFNAYARVNINPFPQDRLLPKDYELYFREDLLSSMLTVTLDITIDGDDDPQSFTFYTPMHPFLIDAERIIPSGVFKADVVEWERWGPDLTRWIGGVDDEDSLDSSYLSSLPYYREGSRILASDRFIDFAPFRIRYAKTQLRHTEANASNSGSAGPWPDLGGYAIIEKPTILKSNVFENGHVVSRLPFLERRLDIPEAVSCMLIGDSVMLVSEGYVNMEIYALAK